MRLARCGRRRRSALSIEASASKTPYCIVAFVLQKGKAKTHFRVVESRLKSGRAMRAPVDQGKEACHDDGHDRIKEHRA